MLRGKVKKYLSKEAHKKKKGANNHVEAVESCCYKKGSAINAVGNCEWGFVIFHSLEGGEVEAKNDS